VPNADEKDGELDRNGLLWDVGVVVKDVVVFDKLDEAVEDRWRDT
jgi:hypothetical protein